jgi:hypothetical protein
MGIEAVWVGEVKPERSIKHKTFQVFRGGFATVLDGLAWRCGTGQPRKMAAPAPYLGDDKAGGNG